MAELLPNDVSQATGIDGELLALVPANGDTIGNVTLMRLLKEEAKRRLGVEPADQDYWDARNRLVDHQLLALGRGKGGSVRRLLESRPADAEADEVAQEEKGEAALWEPFHQTVRDFFAKVYRIKYYVTERTARQGRRPTGGKWPRPDVVLVAVRKYEFVPARDLEVITFEIKTEDGYDIDAVFEAAAHSAFAHRSYLAVQVSNIDAATAELERIERECERFGIGLILFTDPSDWDMFDVRVEGAPHAPDAGDVDAFIRSQLSDDNKRTVRELIG